RREGKRRARRGCDGQRGAAGDAVGGLDGDLRRDGHLVAGGFEGCRRRAGGDGDTGRQGDRGSGRRRRQGDPDAAAGSGTGQLDRPGRADVFADFRGREGEGGDGRRADSHRAGLGNAVETGRDGRRGAAGGGGGGDGE